MATIKKGSQEWEFFRDLFDLAEKYDTIEDTFDAWEQYRVDIQVIYNKYMDGSAGLLAKNLLVGFSNFLADSVKEKKNENNGPNSNGAADR